VTGVIGGLIGIIVCVLLYIAFLAPSRDTAQQDRSDNQNTETAPPKSNQVAVVPTSQIAVRVKRQPHRLKARVPLKLKPVQPASPGCRGHTRVAGSSTMVQ
jgi:hypothetical protein